MTPVAEALRLAASGARLPRPLAEAAFADVMDGRATHAQQGGLLLALAARGETADEVAGAVAALRARMRRVASRRAPLLDTCGPGGLGRDLFNVSTAAAIVAAGAGAAVAKHGNRSISSRVGSADVLEASGVRVDLEPDAAGRVLDETGLAFLFAPGFHPALRALAALRRELGVRTILNVLGPLANPAGATRQLIGVGRPALVRLLGEALAALGGERAIVFHSAAGLDELVPGCPAEGLEVADGTTKAWRFDPADVPQPPVPVEALRGGDADENARMLERLLAGEPGPRREAVLLNAAVALVVAGCADGVREGHALAAEALDRGEAGRRFESLKEASRAA